MRRISDTTPNGLQPGSKRSEAIRPRGSLVIWRRANGVREWYYRRRLKDAPEVSIKLGTFPVLSVEDARAKANELAKLTHEASDIKFLLAQEELIRRRAEEEAKRAQQRAEALGTLKDLCAAYVHKMQSDGRKSWRKVESALKRYVLDPFPELSARRAKDITSDDIADILAAMLAKGITTHVNRTRGDLHAAFNMGMKFDHTPSLRTEKRLYFEINQNPVDKIPTEKKWERTLHRHLRSDELHTVWHESLMHMSPVYASLLRVMICTGFHPCELLRLKVKDVDPIEKTIYMTATKSGVPNLIPLNRFAWAELEPVIHAQSPECSLFPSHVSAPRSDEYARASVLANQIKRLRDNIQGVEHFTARDIRRTVKTLMGKAGISKELRDRLQNHALSDTSSKHYDRYDYWPEKHSAMLKWESWLENHVISPHTFSSKAVNL